MAMEISRTAIVRDLAARKQCQYLGKGLEQWMEGANIPFFAIADCDVVHWCSQSRCDMGGALRRTLGSEHGPHGSGGT